MEFNTNIKLMTMENLALMKITMINILKTKLILFLILSKLQSINLNIWFNNL